MQKENDLAHLLSVRERREEETKREWAVGPAIWYGWVAECSRPCSTSQDTLKEEGFSNDAALDATIKKLEADLKKARKKEADGENEEVRPSMHKHFLPTDVVLPQPEEPPSFPLVDVPDEEVSEISC